MSFLTGLALRRRSVTILAILLVLASGILTYRSLQVELFPDIEFPLVTVSTFYPSANPEAVVRDVTAPIENAISGVDGIDDIKTISSESRSLVLANFTFGTDMDEAARTIESNLAGVRFPAGVREPRVGRINPETFPVLQLSVLGDRDLPELQRILDSLVLPAVSSIDGVFSVEVTGAVDEQVQVAVDPSRLSEMGISLLQVSRALGENSVTVPAGAITDQDQTFPIRTTHVYGSLEELRGLVVGVVGGTASSGARTDGSVGRPVLLSDVADVGLGTGIASSISRTNGKPSLGVGVIKEPDANTVDVTNGVLDSLAELSLPTGVEIVIISDDGPEIQGQIDTLQREALFGFIFAVAVVFVMLLTLRPTPVRGVLLTIRPTLVIGMSIPLSIFTGILLMGIQGMTLNLMTLGGLAISVGRVVDDSIVVLENVYRHTRRGEERWRVALEATREVAPAITASTLTTIVVFVPLAFIQGLVGSFFLPFAITVTFALVASLLVALTAVPVLGALFLRPGDMSLGGTGEGTSRDDETWMQRAYTPALLWALRHKASTLVGAIVLTVGSLALVLVIPITLFHGGGERFLSIDVSLPAGTSTERIFDEVDRIEEALAGLANEGHVEAYLTTVGSPEDVFGGGPGVGASGDAGIFVRVARDAPDDIVESLRAEFPGDDERKITVTELGAGPPESGLEIDVTGNDYAALSDVARRLVADLGQIDDVVNVSSDVTEARDEIVINVAPDRAAAMGLTVRDVALQVNQFMVGQTVTQVTLDGVATSVVVRGRPEEVDTIDKVSALPISGLFGSTRLDDVADVTFERGPVTIARSNGRRSASITGSITADNTQAVGREVQSRIDAVDLPPGVEVTQGGIFQQIAEGFQDIFLAMGVGVVLVYLVMVASLGSLRNPLVIVISLPLALIGVLSSLAITGRTLGLPAMMGILLLVGIVVTNAIVLIAFVEQLRERGMSVHEALVQGGRTRLRPILMTALTTNFALLPLAAFASEEGGIIGVELATVVIGGLVSSSFLTLIVVPVIYTVAHETIPAWLGRIGSGLRRTVSGAQAVAGDPSESQR